MPWEDEDEGRWRRYFGQLLNGNEQRWIGIKWGNYRGISMSTGCVDHVFVPKQLVYKYRETGKDLYIAFVDVEKVYDTVCREELWQLLNEYMVDAGHM